MKITHTTKAKALIQATLFDRLEWHPTGTITTKGLKLKTATARFLKSSITIDFQNKIIKVDGSRQRIKSSTASDLMELVKLKLIKNIKYAQ